jgi:hypothetical protein
MKYYLLLLLLLISNIIVDGEWTEERIARAKKVVEDNLEEINRLAKG